MRGGVTDIICALQPKNSGENTETAIPQNDRVDRLPLELCPVKNLYYVCQGDKSSANMPGNAALCKPIDLQSE